MVYGVLTAKWTHKRQKWAQSVISFNYGGTFSRASVLALGYSYLNIYTDAFFSFLCYQISHVLNNFLGNWIAFFSFLRILNEWKRPNETESYANTVSINKTKRITSITRRSAPSLLPSACLQCWTWNVTVQFNSERTKIRLGPHLNSRPERSEQFRVPQVWITEYSCILGSFVYLFLKAAVCS